VCGSSQRGSVHKVPWLRRVKTLAEHAQVPVVPPVETLVRNYPKNLRISGWKMDGCILIYPFRLRTETFFRPNGYRSSKWCYFTLHFSCFEVERGRLGEVVSLVGDCRPPPPGNPHRPTILDQCKTGLHRKVMSPVNNTQGSLIFSSKKKNIGEVLLKIWKQFSFNRYQITINLKKLNNIQYFKNNCSYFYCMVKNHVLEFAHFHSHLYGLRDVKPPSIANTNVLGN
jgi:hypothetical protein